MLLQTADMQNVYPSRVFDRRYCAQLIFLDKRAREKKMRSIRENRYHLRAISHRFPTARTTLILAFLQTSSDNCDRDSTTCIVIAAPNCSVFSGFFHVNFKLGRRQDWLR